MILKSPEICKPAYQNYDNKNKKNLLSAIQKQRRLFAIQYFSQNKLNNTEVNSGNIRNLLANKSDTSGVSYDTYHSNPSKTQVNIIHPSEKKMYLNEDKYAQTPSIFLYFGGTRLEFLVDTGAAVSVIIHNKISEGTMNDTPKQIKQFLGQIGYYRRFINNFSKIAKPLTQLFKKDIEFLWEKQQEDAFQYFNEIVTNILQLPNFQGEVGKDLPIAYAPRTLKKAAENCSVIEKELLATV